MKNKKNVIIAAAVVLVTLASIPLIAGGARRHHGSELHSMDGFGRGFPQLRFLKNELDLTDVQEAQLKSIAAQVRQENAQYRRELHGDFREAATILLANPGDVAGAEAVLDESRAAREKMQTNILSGVSRALQVLTPEQRVRLTEVLRKHAPRG